jgi:CheY-like chemotaxis protein
MEAENKKTILVVDDDPVILETLQEFLKSLGYVVLSAGDGEKAVELLETAKVDILLTDLILPSMHGISLLKIAKGLSPDRPVVVMTGYGERLAQEAVSAGADSFLLKPTLSGRPAMCKGGREGTRY